MTFQCPRCRRPVLETFYGPCTRCREEMRREIHFPVFARPEWEGDESCPV